MKVENFQKFHISKSKAAPDEEDYNLSWNPGLISLPSV